MNLKKLVLALISWMLLSTGLTFADSWSTNSLGITSGTLGGQSFSSSTNSLGITSGSIGNQSFSCSTNSLGITTCN